MNPMDLHFDECLPREKRRGLVIVNTGNGKGKTSASLGAAFRALGWNWRVRIIQFFKGHWMTGEKQLCNRLPLSIEWFDMEGDWNPDRSESSIKSPTIGDSWALARNSLARGEHDLLILDEINVALAFLLLSTEEVIDVLRNRPSWMHVICTGRNAPPALIEFADLVSEIREIKHPYHAGIAAQAGIEY